MKSLSVAGGDPDARIGNCASGGRSGAKQNRQNLISPLDSVNESDHLVLFGAMAFAISIGSDVLSRVRAPGALATRSSPAPYRDLQGYLEPPEHLTFSPQSIGDASMLRNALALTGLSIQAMDGEIGTASDLLFDDENWVRALAGCGYRLLADRQEGLAAIHAFAARSWAPSHSVDLSKEQVRASPDVDTEKPGFTTICSAEVQPLVARSVLLPSPFRNPATPRLQGE